MDRAGVATRARASTETGEAAVANETKLNSGRFHARDGGRLRKRRLELVLHAVLAVRPGPSLAWRVDARDAAPAPLTVRRRHKRAKRAVTGA
eukprot:scaffold1282_cov251-Pinguiococcus_pyrenoidosus.AAC.65